MIVDKNHPDFLTHSVVNGDMGEIMNVTQFDTESKECVIMLLDDHNITLLNTNKEPIKVRVVIPNARLVKVA